MPSKWIGFIHSGQGGKRWSLREKAYGYDPENTLCNAGIPEYNMQLQVEFTTEPTKEDWPASFQRVRLPSTNTRAR